MDATEGRRTNRQVEMSNTSSIVFRRTTKATEQALSRARKAYNVNTDSRAAQEMIERYWKHVERRDELDQRLTALSLNLKTFLEDQDQVQRLENDLASTRRELRSLLKEYDAADRQLRIG